MRTPKITRMSDQLAACAPDYRLMTHAQRIAALAEIERGIARRQADRARLLAAIDPDPLAERDARGELDKHWEREEVALALKLSSGTTRLIMCEAVDLVTRFPATHARLETGAITAGMTRRLVEACTQLPDEVAAAVEARVLARAAEQSQSQFAASVRRAVQTLAPRKAEEQHADAREQRRIAVIHQPDGTSELWATGLLGADAVAMHARIRELARAWKQQHPDDPRTSGQRQADAFVALLLAQPDAVEGVALRPAVNITVAASTLLGHDDQPADLDGHGHIPAAVARALATDPSGTWRRLLTDENNRIVDLSARTYRPPANIARLVRAQRPRCCFPGCRRRATSCELDHVTPWSQGGTTSAANLQPLCSRHHHLKHETRWSVHTEPDGSTRWTSPTGHRYRRPPDELPRDTTGDPPSLVSTTSGSGTVDRSSHSKSCRPVCSEPTSR